MNWGFSGSKGNRKGFLGRGNHDFLGKEDLKEGGVLREREGGRKEDSLVVSCMQSSGGNKEHKRTFFLSLNYFPRLSPVWPLEAFEFVTHDLQEWEWRGEELLSQECRVFRNSLAPFLIVTLDLPVVFAQACLGSKIRHLLLTFASTPPHSRPRAAVGETRGGSSPVLVCMLSTHWWLMEARRWWGGLVSDRKRFQGTKSIHSHVDPLPRQVQV